MSIIDAFRVMRSDRSNRESCTFRRKVRPYKQCLPTHGYGSRDLVDIGRILDVAQYIIRADGKGDEPHCLSILIHGPEVAHLYDGDTVYQIGVSCILGNL